MKSKFYFEDFKDQINKEHKEIDAVLETKEIPSSKCNHKGKVKAVEGGLRCQCGAGWQGKDLDILLNLLNGL